MMIEFFDKNRQLLIGRLSRSVTRNRATALFQEVKNVISKKEKINVGAVIRIIES